MFYLIWQMGLLLLIAVGIGVFIGRQIWSGDARSQEADEALAEVDRLRRENENLARRLGECEVRGTQDNAESAVDTHLTSSATSEAAPVESIKTGASASPLDDAPATPAVETPKDDLEKQPAEDVKTGAAALPDAAEAETSGDDDLTKIKGLGPKAAAALKAEGVTRYAQIAEWSDEEIAAWDSKINGRGRIARDDWVGQAKAFG